MLPIPITCDAELISMQACVDQLVQDWEPLTDENTVYVTAPYP